MHKPKVGEAVRVVWDNEAGHHEKIGICTEIARHQVTAHDTWFRVWFPPNPPLDGYTVGYESYSLWKLSLLEKLAVAADERFAGRMKK
jgi:hypothetical protein